MWLSLLETVGQSVVARTTLVDWAVVGMVLTGIGGVVVRVIIPGWLRIKLMQAEAPGATTTVVRTNGDGEWRGRIGEQLDQQDKRLDALVAATAAMEKLLVEIERRTDGADTAIQAVVGMGPKLDLILATALRKRVTKRKP